MATLLFRQALPSNTIFHSWQRGNITFNWWIMFTRSRKYPSDVFQTERMLYWRKTISSIQYFVVTLNLIGPVPESDLFICWMHQSFMINPTPHLSTRCWSIINNKDLRLTHGWTETLWLGDASLWIWGAQLLKVFLFGCWSCIFPDQTSGHVSVGVRCF